MTLTSTVACSDSHGSVESRALGPACAAGGSGLSQMGHWSDVLSRFETGISFLDESCPTLVLASASAIFRGARHHAPYVAATAEKTKAALEKIANGMIKAAQPKHVPDSQGKTAFIRYTPGQQGGANGLKQRIIKMSEVVEDP